MRNIICFIFLERIEALVKEDHRQQVKEVLPTRDFEVAYRLDCRNLCADFQEDIDFHFSLGITALMNRFLGPKTRKTVLRGYGEVQLLLFCFNINFFLLIYHIYASSKLLLNHEISNNVI